MIENKIKFYREKMGLSKRELSKRTGISRPHIIQMEKGAQMPTVGMVVRLAKSLNVSPPYKLYPQLDRG